jgi:hypothetical protein
LLIWTQKLAWGGLNMTKKLTYKQVIKQAELSLVILSQQIWRDKKMNACGTKAGDALDVHAIEDALKMIRKYKRQKP